MSARQFIESGLPVPGWLSRDEAEVMLVVAEAQRALGVHGDLLEVGVYLGQSAVLLGYLCAPGERLVLCDLFEVMPGDTEMDAEQVRTYPDLARVAFEQHYARFHDTPATVLVGRSDDRLPELPSATFRLVHIDGSHTFHGVRGDIAQARRLLVPDGLVIFDDIAQARHAPGVAAAVWEAIATGGLIPLGISANKLIGTWSPDPEMLGRLQRAFDESGRVEVRDRHVVHGHEVLELHARPLPPAAADPVAVPEPVGPMVVRQRLPRTRRVVRRTMPPVLFDALLRVRDGVARRRQ